MMPYVQFTEAANVDYLDLFNKLDIKICPL